MPNPRQSQRRKQDLAQRIEQLNSLVERLNAEIDKINRDGEIAPSGCWIVRYLSVGKGGRYWYYKWMAAEPIFVTKKGNPSRSQYLGKAGSEAYLKAVEMLSRRVQIEALERAIGVLSQGLGDLVEEATRCQKDSRVVSE